MKTLKSALSLVPAYVALQKALGGDVLRYRSIDALNLKPGDVVIDVGCGPAYYFDRLPSPLTYHGFDTDAGYIDHATRKYGDRGTFHLGIFDETAAAELPAPDAVMLLGLLHHLSDDECDALLKLSSSILAPGGQVVSVDPTFIPDQSRISRWMSENDRGEYVRKPQGFVDLANTHFAEIDGHVVSGEGRVPGSHWLMRMTAPRVTASPGTA